MFYMVRWVVKLKRVWSNMNIYQEDIYNKSDMLLQYNLASQEEASSLSVVLEYIDETWP